VGTVQVFTKDRMLAIEAGTITSGTVDVDGNLILTRHDGSTYDAGKVYPIAATTDVSGLVELATSIETIAGTDDVRVVTPSGLAALTSTESRRGLIELATSVEGIAGTDISRAVTPKVLDDVLNNKAISPTTGVSFKGVVSSAWFFGLPTVTLTDGTILTNVHFTSDAQDMDIRAGDSVLVTRVGSTYYISGRDISTKLSWLPVWAAPIPAGTIGTYASHLLQDPAQEYSEQQTLTGFNTIMGNGYVLCTMSSTGIVSLEGLLTATSFVNGQIICTLPIAMRPAYDQVFTCANAGGNQTIYVCADDGTVRMGPIVGAGATSYFSLYNVVFRAAGYGTFVPISLVAGHSVWTAGPATTANTVSNQLPGCSPTRVSRIGYTIDLDGVILFEGLITTPAVVAAGTMADMSAYYPGALAGRHFPLWCLNVYMYCRISNAAGAGGFGKILNYGVAVGANYRISLSNLKDVPVPGPNTTGWLAPAGLSSWTAYDAPNTAWTVPGMLRTPDGLVFLKGLWGNGTTGVLMSFLPRRWRTRQRAISLIVATGATGRMDINTTQTPLSSNTNGGDGMGWIATYSGTATWWSWNGVSFAAGRRASENQEILR